MSETQDPQLQPNVKPLEAPPQSSACQEMMTQGVSKEKNHLGSSPGKGEGCGADHQEGPQLRSFHLSPQEQSARHRDRRQSWRRSSMKEINRRKSLAPFHPGMTGGVLCT